MTRTPIRLGPFQLFEPVGAGGMGQVWLGEHVAQGVPVAVKLLHERPSDGVAAAFRREVRAVAGLDHPNVVLVLDTGEVDATAARASGMRLPLGAPWLAMEYADGGSLSTRRGRLGWPALSEILMALLDALAHAHARGVVHLDLKLGNVMLGGLRPGVKLTDFGIAHLRPLDGRTEVDLPRGGTPAYMAPEQFEGRWRDCGPWTDLYALGVVAWSLVTGEPPFRAGGWPGYAKAHLTQRPPALRPVRAVPAALESWLRRLLAKDPVWRFRRAADAAWALQDLGPPVDTGRQRASLADEAGDGPTMILDPPTITQSPTAAPRTTLFWQEPTTDVQDLPPAVAPGGASPRLAPAPWPRLPRRWQRPASRAPVPLRNAGLGLFGLRRVGLVGRTRERDVLWAELRAAVRGAPRAVQLRGAAGSGKSRLAAWLCHRAHELGGASVLSALHSPSPGPADGVAAMIGRWLGCVGLPRSEGRARLETLLPTFGIDDQETLVGATEWLFPVGVEERTEGTLRLTDAERRVLAIRLVEALAIERPVVLWVDDVQWGSEALALVQALLERPIPLLALLTVQEEALGDDADVAAALQALPSVEVGVGPLSDEDTMDLLSGLVGLEQGWMDQLRSRIDGNPLFAVHLVGDWVSRGLLVPGPAGFVVRQGATLELPDDVHEVWRGRISEVIGGVEVRRESLTVAACLGQEVDLQEWRAALRSAGVGVPEGLVDRMLDEHLWRPIGRGEVGFVHGMLRESLLRSAAGSGRLAAFHRACAEVVAQRPGPGRQARVGRHRLAAGDAAEAFALLHAAGREATRMGEFREAREVLTLAVQALEQRGVARTDVAWGVLQAEMAEACRARGDLAAADRWAEAVLAGPDTPGWLGARARARYVKAFLLVKEHRLAEAVVALTASAVELEARGEPSLAVRSRVVLAIVHQFSGELERAEEVIAVALRLASALSDDPLVRAEAQRVRGAVALQRGRLEIAEEAYRSARVSFAALGHRAGRSLADAGLGDVARFSGRLDEAEGRYRSAVAGLEAGGSASAASVRMNLALLSMERDAWAEALEVLRAGMAELEGSGSHLESIGIFRFLTLPCHAGMADWVAFDAVLDSGTPPVVDADIARALERAAVLATAAGHPGRAGRVAALAEAQRSALEA